MGLTGRRNLSQPQISGERTKEQPRRREEGEQEPRSRMGEEFGGRQARERQSPPRWAQLPECRWAPAQCPVGPAHGGEQIPSQVLSRWL